ncbi:hypothetical protein HWV62_38859, partial [Athelia sp. TMB]
NSMALTKLNGGKGPSPSPSPSPSSPPNHPEGQEPEVQSSTEDDYIFVELSRREYAMILQMREAVSEAVKPVAKQRDEAYQQRENMEINSNYLELWADAMVAQFQYLGVDVPSCPEITADNM